MHFLVDAIFVRIQTSTKNSNKKVPKTTLCFFFNILRRAIFRKSIEPAFFCYGGGVNKSLLAAVRWILTGNRIVGNFRQNDVGYLMKNFCLVVRFFFLLFQ